MHSQGIEPMTLALQMHIAQVAAAVTQAAVQLGKVVLSESRTVVNK